MMKYFLETTCTVILSMFSIHTCTRPAPSSSLIAASILITPQPWMDYEQLGPWAQPDNGGPPSLLCKMLRHWTTTYETFTSGRIIVFLCSSPTEFYLRPLFRFRLSFSLNSVCDAVTVTVITSSLKKHMCCIGLRTFVLLPLFLCSGEGRVVPAGRCLVSSQSTMRRPCSRRSFWTGSAAVEEVRKLPWWNTRHRFVDDVWIIVGFENDNIYWFLQASMHSGFVLYSTFPRRKHQVFPAQQFYTIVFIKEKSSLPEKSTLFRFYHFWFYLLIIECD